ncbi:MFS transporter [Luteimicrobium xylanilyticum]|uniref:Putative MFS-type transporter YhcA n=1 Tax=Luteimicrobium xylanilyticum TaxID=1133546 RepID=A0A5P9QDR5_9MICO|nr:MFS transporter [Luteimicrobium xylanilyticum]QFU99604.1 putative MFS-type transporter YhcA [Luteimicrobium xylanilyticum]
MTVIAEPAAPTRPLTRTGLVVLLAGPFLANLDFFITNAALPSIRRDLAASSAALELVVAGYGTAYAVMLVLAGRLGDEHGRRRLFAVGRGAFTVTSLAAGMSTTVSTLLLARVLQGASAALMTPQTLATVQSALTGRRRASAIAAYAAAGGLAAVVGQLLGGVLVSTLSWRAIFLVNVPVGLTALLLLRRTVPPTRSERRVGADVRGTVLLAVSIGALLVPLAEGPALRWPGWCTASLVLSGVASGTFVAWSARAPRRGIVPLLPLALVTGVPSMRRGLPVVVGFFGVFGAFMFVFAVGAQEGLGLSPLAAGIAITPVCLAYFATSFVVPRLLERLGRRVLALGLAVEAVGLAATLAIVVTAWRSLGGDADRSSPPVVAAAAVLALVVVGVGQALAVGSLFRLILSEVPAESAGVGSGLLVTTQQTAMALGVAGLGSIFSAVAAGSMRAGVIVAFAVMSGLTLLLAALSLRLPQHG